MIVEYILTNQNFWKIAQIFDKPIEFTLFIDPDVTSGNMASAKGLGFRNIDYDSLKGKKRPDHPLKTEIIKSVSLKTESSKKVSPYITSSKNRNIKQLSFLFGKILVFSKNLKTSFFKFN